MNGWGLLHRTKTLVLELLAAICLVSGGHQMILSAFDNFKHVCDCCKYHFLSIVTATNK